MEYVQTLEPGEFTLADLDALPEDGMQYELVDGILLVTPSPTRCTNTQRSNSLSHYRQAAQGISRFSLHS